MTIKHTPGPWEIDADTRPAEVCTVHHTSHPNGFVYVRGALGYWDATPEENMANARLIAAAPDLLKALSMCVASMKSCLPDFNPHDQAAYDAAMAAIAKATGDEE